jgi:hypothetical protein
MRLTLFVYILLLLKTGSYSQQAAGDLLFTIERSRGENEIHFTLNLDESGQLNRENPIKIFWVKYAEDGQSEPLTTIQQKFANGLKFLNTDAFPIEFQFVSYQKKSLFLDKKPDGFYRVFTFADETGDFVQLNRIVNRIAGGSFWFPSISRVELNVSIPRCKTEYAEIIKP